MERGGRRAGLADASTGASMSHRGSAIDAAQRQRARLRARLRDRIAAELDHQPGLARRQQRDVRQPQPAFAQPADDGFVEALAGDRRERRAPRARRRPRRRCRESRAPQHAAGGLSTRRASACKVSAQVPSRADQSARDVEAFFRQQLVQVVARDAPRGSAGSGCGSGERTSRAMRLQRGIDLALPAARDEDALHLDIASVGPHQKRAPS